MCCDEGVSGSRAQQAGTTTTQEQEKEEEEHTGITDDEDEGEPEYEHLGRATLKATSEALLEVRVVRPAWDCCCDSLGEI